MEKFFDLEFAQGRLTHTFVRSKGEHYYCHRVIGDEQKLVCHRHGDEVVLNIEDVDFEPPVAGYINAMGGAKYFCRKPQRRWKQGLSADMFGGLPVDTVIKALDGNYPKFRRSLRSDKKVAFNLRWACMAPKEKEGFGFLYYKDRHVGNYSFDGAVDFKEKFLFLREAFEEVIR